MFDNCAMRSSSSAVVRTAALTGAVGCSWNVLNEKLEDAEAKYGELADIIMHAQVSLYNYTI